MTIYKSVSKAYVEYTLHPSVRGKLLVPTYNLSAIVGDKKGKISKGTSSQIMDTTQVIRPGTIILEDEHSVDHIVNDTGMPSEMFIKEVSAKAFQVYSLFKEGSTEVLVHSLSVDSPLLSYDNMLNPKLKTVLGSIFLEAFTLYKELLGITPEVTKYALADSDLVRMSNNLRWVSDRMEAESNLDYEILECLRDLHRTILYIRKLDIF